MILQSAITFVFLFLVIGTNGREIVRHKPENLASLAVRNVEKQSRVIPGPITITTLAILKFKKIIPLSVILLKSNIEEEPSYVPVYANTEIPEDVQFIATPDGFGGHEDIQAIAVPNKFYNKLREYNMDHIETIAALLREAHLTEDGDLVITVADTTIVINDNNQYASLEEEDQEELVAENPFDQIPTKEKPHNTANTDIKPSNHFFLHIADNFNTTIEEIPIFLYTNNAQIKPRLHHYQLSKLIKHN